MYRLPRLALTRLDPDKKTQLAFSPSISADERRVLGKIRAPAEIGTDDEWKYLRSDVWLVEDILIDGDSATFRVWRGPMPRRQPGVISLSCGTTSTYYFKKVTGVWQFLDRMTIEAC